MIKQLFQKLNKWYRTNYFRTEQLHYFYRPSSASKYNPKNESRKWLFKIEIVLVMVFLPLMPLFWWLRQVFFRVAFLVMPQIKNYVPIAWLSRYIWYRKRIGGQWYENRHWSDRHKIAVYIWSRRHASIYPYTLGITTALMEKHPVLVQTNIQTN